MGSFRAATRTAPHGGHASHACFCSFSIQNTDTARKNTKWQSASAVPDQSGSQMLLTALVDDFGGSML